MSIYGHLVQLQPSSSRGKKKKKRIGSVIVYLLTTLTYFLSILFHIFGLIFILRGSFFFFSFLRKLRFHHLGVVCGCCMHGYTCMCRI